MGDTKQIDRSELQAQGAKLLAEFFPNDKLPPPVFRIVDQLSSRWLGRCTFDPKKPITTLIEVQKRVLGDPKSLERILAHELVHHADFMLHSAPLVHDARAYRQQRNSNKDHAGWFAEQMQRINGLRGKNFITPTSDEDMVVNNEKPFYVLIREGQRKDQLGWIWFQRPSAEDKIQIEAILNLYKGKLFQTTDRSFLTKKKMPISTGSFYVPTDKMAEKLRELYDTGKTVVLAGGWYSWDSEPPYDGHPMDQVEYDTPPFPVLLNNTGPINFNDPKDRVAKAEEVLESATKEEIKKMYAATTSFLSWGVSIQGDWDHHITCKFFKDVPVTPEQIEEALKGIDVSPPKVSELSWEPVEFDTKNIDKVKVLELKRYPKRLADAHFALEAIRKDDYPDYRPHVTVSEELWARIKKEKLGPGDLQMEVGPLTFENKGTIEKVFSWVTAATNELRFKTTPPRWNGKTPADAYMNFGDKTYLIPTDPVSWVTEYLQLPEGTLYYEFYEKPDEASDGETEETNQAPDEATGPVLKNPQPAAIPDDFFEQYQDAILYYNGQFQAYKSDDAFQTFVLRVLMAQTSRMPSFKVKTKQPAVNKSIQTQAFLKQGLKALSELGDIVDTRITKNVTSDPPYWEGNNPMDDSNYLKTDADDRTPWLVGSKVEVEFEVSPWGEDGTDDPTVSDFRIKIKHKGKEIGYGLFYHENNSLYCQEVEIDKKYQRQGIGTSLYDYASELAGKRIRPTGNPETGKGFDDTEADKMTDLAQKFWQKRLKIKSSSEDGFEEIPNYREQLYHGSVKPIATWTMDGAGRYGKGLYLTPDKKIAEFYAQGGRQGAAGQKLLPEPKHVYTFDVKGKALKILNEDEFFRWFQGEYEPAGEAFNHCGDYMSSRVTKFVSEWAKEEGYDIIVMAEKEPGVLSPFDQVVVLNPKALVYKKEIQGGFDDHFLLARMREDAAPADPELIAAANKTAREAYAKVRASNQQDAAGMLFESDGKLLLMQRTGAGDHDGEWGIPGGGVQDTDKGPWGTAIRECEEEMGCCPEYTDTGRSTNWDQDGLKYTTFLVNVDETFEPILNEEHGRAQWFPVNELPNELHPGVAWTVQQLYGPTPDQCSEFKETLSVVVDKKVWITPPLEEVEKVFANEPDGICDDGNRWVAKKVSGKIVGAIKILERDSANDMESIPSKRLSRIDSIFVDETQRGRGIGKELLLYLIRKDGAVESNLTATPSGDALWKSLKGISDISVQYNDNDTDYGHVAWVKSEAESTLSKKAAPKKKKKPAPSMMKGKPASLTLYRGTIDHPPHSIDPLYRGQGIFGEGTYFGLDFQTARSYTDAASQFGLVNEYAAKFKNLVSFDDEEIEGLASAGGTGQIEFQPDAMEKMGYEYSEHGYQISTDKLVEDAAEVGFDGIELQGHVDGGEQLIVPTNAVPDLKLKRFWVRVNEEELNQQLAKTLKVKPEQTGWIECKTTQSDQVEDFLRAQNWDAYVETKVKASTMSLKQFLEIVTTVADEHGFAFPEKAYFQCSDFSFAVAIMAREQGIPCELYSAKLVSKVDHDEVKKGDTFAHTFLKFGDRFYDFTARQVDPEIPFPHVFKQDPQYKNVTAIKTPSGTDDGSEFYYKALWDQIHKDASAESSGKPMKVKAAASESFLPPELVMVDCEMTGVKPHRDALLQIAMTKLKLQGIQYVEYDEPLVLYLHYEGAPQNEFQKEHLSEIIEMCNKSQLNADQAKVKIDAWLGELKGKVTPAGDCVPTDIRFLIEKGAIEENDIDDNGQIPGTFHYEYFDANGIKAIARTKAGKKEDKAGLPGFDQENEHDALVDCRNQTIELNYYLNILLGAPEETKEPKPETEPAKDETKAPASETKPAKTETPARVIAATYPPELSGNELLDLFWEMSPDPTGGDRVERVLKEVGGSWHLTRVPIASIAFSDGSVEGPSSQRLIKRYSKQPTEAPPVILDEPLKEGEYEIVDGFHRIAVAKAQGKTDILAYVPGKAPVTAGAKKKEVEYDDLPSDMDDLRFTDEKKLALLRFEGKALRCDSFQDFQELLNKILVELQLVEDYRKSVAVFLNKLRKQKAYETL